MNNPKRNRKSIALLITAFLMLALLTACGQSNQSNNDDGVYVNKNYADSGMLTIGKETFDYGKGKLLNTAGLGVQLPQALQEMLENGQLKILGAEYTLNFIYLTEKGMEEMGADTIFQCYAISHILDNDENAEMELERIKGFFTNVEVIAAVDGGTYYFAYNDDCSALTTSDKDKTAIDLLISEREAVRNGICLFPAEKITLPSNVNMNDFSTKTLNDDTFTQAEFADYDLTMVNIWTTWCGPCVGEMPELQSLYEVLPDNVNMITICADANEESELAKQILAELGCDFQTLYPNEQIESSLLNEITSYPTTIFVDRNGNMVGEPQIGVPGKNPAEEYMKRIEERLSDVTGMSGAAGQ